MHTHPHRHHHRIIASAARAGYTQINAVIDDPLVPTLIDVAYRIYRVQIIVGGDGTPFILEVRSERRAGRSRYRGGGEHGQSD